VVIVTEATGWHVRPVDGLAVNVTVPVNVPSEVTVTVDEPELVARMPTGETGARETVKLALGVTVTPAAPFTVLNNVDADAAVPLTVTTKFAEGSGLQVTEIRPEELTVAVQPVGCVDVTA
jgi:hypothetical protein